MARLTKRIRTASVETLDEEKDRFCIYCGVWFDDKLTQCSNCNQVKSPIAAARIKDKTLDKIVDELDKLSERLKSHEL